MLVKYVNKFQLVFPVLIKKSLKLPIKNLVSTAEIFVDKPLQPPSSQKALVMLSFLILKYGDI